MTTTSAPTKRIVLTSRCTSVACYGKPIAGHPLRCPYCRGTLLLYSRTEA